MQLPTYMRKAATFADEVGPAKAVSVQCDGDNPVTVTATNGRVFCQYEILASDNEGTWQAAVHPKDWEACTTWKPARAFVDIQDGASAITVGPLPAAETNYRVTLDKVESPKDIDANSLLAESHRVAKVDPAYLKKVVDAAIAAKASSVFLKVPEDQDQPLVVTAKDGRNQGSVFFAIAQMAHEPKAAE